MHTTSWCLGQNQDPHCMQVATQPMMTDYSSIHAGIVVDTVSHAPNALFKFANDTGFAEWLENRKYVEKFLDSYGLLGNQTIMNKIYPSNSGPTASYGELIAENIMGPNLMDPLHSALLMLYVVFGGVVPEGDAYMTDLLTEQTFSDATSFGFGLPPGSVLHSVLGTSSTDVNEIAHVILPNGRELIMSAFTDGYQNFGNPPYQSSILGIFAENLILGLNLTTGNPTRIIMDTAQATVSPTGGWKTGQSIQAYNNTYLYMAGGNITPYSVVWTIPINTTGLYEVCVWFPAALNQTNVAIYTVATQSNDNRQYVINQQHYGARWILLDSFYFVKGSNPMVHISNTNIPAGQIVVADTIKVTMWPTTDNIPGLAPSYVNENYNYAYN
ncbi:golvesin [Heterostelium album PN500]|uniref:Golvesin n=1 Tax=Heterostelium pallidum (strain ATCC 26659 / Pp 5 / PN500) TaxID=670386 RepID=D3BP88_HETP5|nr:golvesin [Heterostelium album PN500]EFA77098.1 golvesin [Heterostelium album PN500]|eukprot:XP_020429227.1 golvesin [Heterostelium album PN500]